MSETSPLAPQSKLIFARTGLNLNEHQKELLRKVAKQERMTQQALMIKILMPRLKEMLCK